MATLTLPMPSASNETLRVSLEGSTYSFRYLWNARDNCWFLSLATADGTQIMSGKRVVIGWDLLQNVSHLSKPPGQIVFFDLSTDDGSITGDLPRLDDLGARVQGYYIES